MTVAILVAAVANALALIPPLLPLGFAGGDFRIYHDAAGRWLETGVFYLPHQLSGAYSITPGDVLYPPTILFLLVPFLFLPSVLWWAFPLTVMGAVTLRFRPARWAWPLIALALWWPRDQGLVVLGNPGMWVGAGIAAGLVLGWPAALVALKPSLAPFALIGIGTRGWWRALGAMVLASLPLLGLWLQYVTVLRNSDGTIGFSLLELPFMLIPIVAFIARTDAEPTPGNAAIRAAAQLPSRLLRLQLTPVSGPGPAGSRSSSGTVAATARSAQLWPARPSDRRPGQAIVSIRIVSVEPRLPVR